MKMLLASILILVLLFLTMNSVQAATHLYRLSWDKNPQHEAVIGFSPKGLSIAPYVMYGSTPNQVSWQKADVSLNATFFTLESHFVRLENLPADSNIYFHVCDQDGCGQRMWFKTAADYPKPFVAIAGGDTRTGWTTRQDGNRLVAKIRPLFIMHGGDFTNGNTPFEMAGFLADWQLTFSDDTIDNIGYKRIYPIVPTHGNHEDTNYATLCEVFGVDYFQDGECNEQDAYGAMTINDLIRVYTLNSQFQESGWSVLATQMNDWLADDLSTYANAPLWRVAQYHKPIFPHYDGKPSNEGLFNWWASLFYKHNMNLVVESDTHINKLTHPLKPAETGIEYLQANNGGTVFVGEGSWGAPARSANQAFPWTIDLASIQQFKVLSVTQESILIRTAQFDDNARALSADDREQDPLALPEKVAWWSANGIGDVFPLIKTTTGLTQHAKQLADNEREFVLSVSDDSFIASEQPTKNYNAYPTGMRVGNTDVTYGETKALLKFTPDVVGTCATLTEANLTLSVQPTDATIESNISALTETGATFAELGVMLNLALIEPQFSESAVNWTTGNILFSSASSGEFDSFETIAAGNTITFTFNEVTLAKLNAQFQQYHAFGFGISATHPIVNRFVSDSENHNAATLRTRFSATAACFEQPSNSLAVPSQITELNANKGDFLTYHIPEVSRARSLEFVLRSGYGDPDLYVLKNGIVSLNHYECRPYLKHESEVCLLEVPEGTPVSIGIHAHSLYSGASLTITEK
ncbi:conserved exported hypothetical protein [Alteromonas sp. 38]|uniref:metallophosphoesterase n=1 Tax=unclassified Alteromonas TaxID=2614992 RepID=UPI0012F42617|nr:MULTISPECIES: metallophosphoesterase [unclassified Alteromonas]CAD5258441.1 conserved exported hypothetical protein [Alteromonas sp. 154]VXC37611.1 conserved exported hypothetical protein [Alteromonas sp. 38]